MIISFASSKLQKVLLNQKMIAQEYGQMAKKIQARLSVLQAARCLEDVPTTKPDRRHQLSQDRDEEFAVDLTHPYRLLFEVANDPIPRKVDGGIDLKAVTAISIKEIIDYH